MFLSVCRFWRETRSANSRQRPRLTASRLSAGTQKTALVTEATIVTGMLHVAPKYQGDNLSAVILPAQRFKAVASDGTSVNASAPAGVFPAGTTMKVTLIDAERALELAQSVSGRTVVDAIAVDITFYDAKGNKIEPKDQNKVQVTINTGRALEGEIFSIYHIADDGSVGLMGSATPNGGSFETGSFSIYIVDGEIEDDYRLFVYFHKADDSEPRLEMINKRQIPQIEKYIFDPGYGDATALQGLLLLGWSTDENYTPETTPMTIDQVRQAIVAKLNEGVTDGQEMHFYAMAFKCYIVTYLDEEAVAIKNEKVMFRADAPETEHTYTVNCAYTPYVKPENVENGIDALFMGWQQLEPETAEMTVYQNTNTFEISTNVILKAVVKNGFWLSFNENLSNATYTAPIFVQANTSPTEPTPPTREGYTFDGWWTEDASSERDGQVTGEPFNFSQTLTERTVVHAKWTQNTNAGYSVVIWQQNVAGGDKYDFVTSIPVSNATVGSTIDAVTVQGTGNGRYARINGTNYQYTTPYPFTAPKPRPRTRCFWMQSAKIMAGRADTVDATASWP